MNPGSSRDGAVPGAECRAFLRRTLGNAAGVTEPADREHVATCAFCAARTEAGKRLAPALRRRPLWPAAASPREMLDGVYERVVTRAETGEQGRLLQKAMPVEAPAPEQLWPDSLLESDIGGHTQIAPAPVSSATWNQVRESILAGVAAVSTGRRRRRWVLGAAGAAAAVTVALALVFAESGRETPNIVFQDLGAPPGVEFAVLRGGALR